MTREERAFSTELGAGAHAGERRRHFAPEKRALEK